MNPNEQIPVSNSVVIPPKSRFALNVKAKLKGVAEQANEKQPDKIEPTEQIKPIDVPNLENKEGVEKKEVVEKIAHQLGFKDPMYHAWDLKYDNHGLFVFDHPGSSHVDNHLYDFLHMFSFCPVY